MLRVALQKAAATVASCACFISCGDASQTTSGGEPRFDAAAGGSAPLACEDKGTAGPSTWSSLYADYFGPTGKASCAGDGQCHGGADQPGAKATGYVCAPNASACYETVTKSRIVVAGDTTTPPEQSLLHVVLRKCDGTGIMPKRPASVVFSPSDMERIHNWLRKGAPND